MIDYVCSKIPGKWNDIAKEFNINPWRTSRRQITDSEKLREMISQRMQKKKPPFTLESLVSVLQSVGEGSLAKELLCKSSFAQETQ